MKEFFNKFIDACEEVIHKYNIPLCTREKVWQSVANMIRDEGTSGYPIAKCLLKDESKSLQLQIVHISAIITVDGNSQ